MCIYSCLGISPFAGVTYTQHGRSMQTIYKLQVTQREFRPQKRRAKGMYVTAIVVCVPSNMRHMYSLYIKGLLSRHVVVLAVILIILCISCVANPGWITYVTILLLYKQWSYNAITCIHTPIQKYFGGGLQYVTIIKLLNHEGWLRWQAMIQTSKLNGAGGLATHPPPELAPGHTTVKN